MTRASRSAEGLQQLLEDLVGAVGGPDLVAGDLDVGLARDIGGESVAQFDGVPLGVAVQRGGQAAHFGDEILDESRSSARTGFSLVLSWLVTVSCGAP
jgi:hypothetical protein